MKLRTQSLGFAALLFAIGFLASPIDDALAVPLCEGVCGNLVADGVVTAPPTGGTYRWISTYGSTNGSDAGAGTGAMPGVLPSDGTVGSTNGTLYKTDPFTVNAATPLNYYFNYVTSDGQTVGGTYVYQDYAWAQLQLNDAAHTVIANLLTARTEPSGSIIPGIGMPSIDATLKSIDGTTVLSSVPIITVDPTLSVGPLWTPLGGSSGTCYGPGCGYTDWVLSTYDIVNAGTYVLVFGVSNWADTAFDSGLAFTGLTIGGNPLPGEGDGENEIATTPLPAAFPLFATGLGALGLLGWRRKRKAQASA